MKPRVLLVDDDHAFRLSTAALLEGSCDVTPAANGKEATELIPDGFDLVLMDVRMPGIQGVDLVEVLRARGEGVPILMISGFGTVETAVRAMHAGADDFLTKPVEPAVLLDRVQRLVETRPQARSTGARLLGRSRSITSVLEDIERVGPSQATVLVTGETGTGKELVARSLHEASQRVGESFVTVNSAGLAESLLESQLFGHVRGAFTGADRDHTGLFETANGGTLFLDEVGDMSLSAQKRLLRVLQEGEVLPVGAVEPRRVNVRVIAATHRDLQQEVDAGRFRADLFYRLNVFHIHLAPLRERKEDLPLLVEHFLSGSGAAGPALSPLAMRRLLDHEWPGNIRQLFAALESARIRAEGGMIHVNHLPPELRVELDDVTGGGARYHAPPEASERETIVSALKQSGGRKAEAARLLGMGRTTLWRKLREHGLEA